MATAAHEYHLNVRSAGKTYSLDFRHAFRFGYGLARTRKFKEAAQIFEALMRSEDARSVATIMFAYCKAGLGDYAGACALLGEVFPPDGTVKPDQLHTVFVYLSVGMWDDATEELAELVRRCPSVPLICLLLGDVLAVKGRQDEAIASWQLAATRDRGNGAVAATARYLISSQTKTKPPPKT